MLSIELCEHQTEYHRPLFVGCANNRPPPPIWGTSATRYNRSGLTIINKRRNGILRPERHGTRQGSRQWLAVSRLEWVLYGQTDIHIHRATRAFLIISIDCGSGIFFSFGVGSQYGLVIVHTQQFPVIYNELMSMRASRSFILIRRVGMYIYMRVRVCYLTIYNIYNTNKYTYAAIVGNIYVLSGLTPLCIY